MMRPGGWRPAAVSPRDIQIIVIVSTSFAHLRVFDYVVPGPPANAAYMVQPAAELVMPLPAWGLLIWAGILVLTVGWIFRVHLPVFLGHGILSFAYWSLALGLVGGYCALILESGATPVTLDGVSRIGPLVTLGLLHSYLFVRTGTHPLPHNVSRPVPGLPPCPDSEDA